MGRRRRGQRHTPGLVPPGLHQPRASGGPAPPATHLLDVFALLLLEAQLVVDVAKVEARHRALLLGGVGTQSSAALSARRPATGDTACDINATMSVLARTSSSSPPLLEVSDMRSWSASSAILADSLVPVPNRQLCVCGPLTRARRPAPPACATSRGSAKCVTRRGCREKCRRPRANDACALTHTLAYKHGDTLRPGPDARGAGEGRLSARPLWRVQASHGRLHRLPP